MGGDPTVVEQGYVLAGRLRLEARLASGSMGEVWRARHLGLEKPVAVKLLRPDHRSDRQTTQRFIREAQTASRLEHPGTVRILDFGRDDSGLLYLAMELVDGPTLFQHLLDRGPLALDEAVDILAQTLAAVAVAHGAGILHRDIKPSNILLSPQEDDEGRPFNRVKVCDFGLAKLIDASESLVGGDVRQIVGTPLYMSPEQATGEPLDARADIYGCGVVLFEMLTGEPPFKGDTPVNVLLAHCQTPLPSARRARPDLPEEVDLVLARAMAKNAEDRFRSARAFRAALLELERSDTPRVPTSSESATAYFIQPSTETAEHDRVPRPDLTRAPRPPDVEGRALLDAIHIESPIEEVRRTQALPLPSADVRASLDRDIDAVIPTPRVPTSDVTRRLGSHPLVRLGVSLGPTPPTGFFLATAEHDPLGPLRCEDTLRLIRGEALRGQASALRVSADPYPNLWRSAEELLEALGATSLISLSSSGDGSRARGRLGPSGLRALLERALGDGTTGRLVVEGERSEGGVAFELHLVGGRVTDVHSSLVELQAPLAWLEHGLLTETDLPRMVGQAWNDGISVQTATRRLTGVDLTKIDASLTANRLRAALRLEDGRWELDPDFVPKRRAAIDQRAGAPAAPPSALHPRSVHTGPVPIPPRDPRRD